MILLRIKIYKRKNGKLFVPNKQRQISSHKIMNYHVQLIFYQRKSWFAYIDFKH